VASEKTKLTGAGQSRSPVIEIPLMNKMKRKRSGSEESPSMRVEQSPLKRRSDKTQWSAADALVKPQLSDKNESLIRSQKKPASSDTTTDVTAAQAIHVANVVPTAPGMRPVLCSNIVGIG